MTAIPDIPTPDTFEPTHTTLGGQEVQILATLGVLKDAVIVWDGKHYVAPHYSSLLTPLPPPLPKARVGWYVLSPEGQLFPRTTLVGALTSVDRDTNVAVAVVKLCADGVLRHVDRDGNEGAPLEVEQ